MAERRTERRLAAIFAGDVAGYSRLMGDDEEGTLARLNAHRREFLEPKISEHRGRIVKRTGDGILIEFASAVNAVRCAMEVQRGMSDRNAPVPVQQRIEFRIGIHIGDIIIEEGDIFGDGVNIAARLEAIADPGGIYISKAACDQVRNKLEAAFEDLGEYELKNIAEPVRVYRVREGGDAHLAEAMTEAMFRAPAIAVLPFANISGDPEQEYFADGLTEDIITALSLWRSFPVIARNSTFVFKGRSVDVQEVGKKLGARYVLEGSVRKAGSRVRVTAQLIDADTAHHVSAERFDRELSDIFGLQDELAARIAARVAPEIARAEAVRSVRKVADNVDAWDYVQRGLALLDQFSADGNARARQMFEKAIAIDPHYSRAHSGLSFSYNRDLLLEFAASRDEAISTAISAAERAIALDRLDSLAHTMLSVANMWPSRFDVVIREGRRAVELNPNNAFARAILGTALDSVGETESGIHELELALQLNPHDNQNALFINTIARAHLISRRYQKAIERAHEAIRLRANTPHAYYILASALGHLGRIGEAGAALQACENIQPGFVARRAGWKPYRSESGNEHILEGIRKAGSAG